MSRREERLRGRDGREVEERSRYSVVDEDNLRRYQGRSCKLCRDPIDHGDVLRTFISCGHNLHVECSDQLEEGPGNRHVTGGECPVCFAQGDSPFRHSQTSSNNHHHSGSRERGAGGEREEDWYDVVTDENLAQYRGSQCFICIDSISLGHAVKCFRRCNHIWHVECLEQVQESGRIGEGDCPCTLCETNSISSTDRRNSSFSDGPTSSSSLSGSSGSSDSSYYSSISDFSISSDISSNNSHSHNNNTSSQPRRSPPSGNGVRSCRNTSEVTASSSNPVPVPAPQPPSTSGSHDSRPETCCICLENNWRSSSSRSGSKNSPTFAPCGHKFHQGCLERWEETGADKCPLCRESLA